MEIGVILVIQLGIGLGRLIQAKVYFATAKLILKLRRKPHWGQTLDPIRGDVADTVYIGYLDALENIFAFSQPSKRLTGH